MPNPYGKPFSPTLEQAAGIRVAYEEGERITAIAGRLGMHHRVVRRAIVKTGGTIKPYYPRGEDHGRWKGGRVIDHDGYVKVWRPGAPLTRTRGRHVDYVYEHRLVMEEHLGRPLRSDETVHHINGDTADNRIENLQLRSSQHGRGQVRVCLDCGSHNIGSEEL